MHAISPSVECRPTGMRGCTLLLLIPTIAFLALAYFLARSLALLFVLAALLALMVLLTAAVERHVSGSVVAADEWGLKQHPGGPTTSLAWEAVTDYYEAPLRSNGSRGSMLVVEGAEAVVRITPSWSNADAFRRVVRQRAVNARPRDWGRLGYRELDERPREFTYPREASCGPSRLVYVIPVSFLVSTIWVFAARGPAIIRDLGWPTGILQLAVVGGMVNSIGALCLFLRPLQHSRCRRQGQQITAAADGLSYRDGVREIQIRWDEIVAHGQEVVPGPLESYRYVVRTHRDEFDYAHTLENAWLLDRFLELYAPPNTRLKAQPSDRIGGPGAGWSSGVEGVGERIFTYRTRTNRAALAFLATLILIIVAAPALRGTLSPSPTTWIGDLSLLLFLGYAAWRYSAGGIRLDERGLTEHSVCGDIRILWSQVEYYGPQSENGSPFLSVKGGSRKVGFYLGIADLEVLLREIAARSTNATTRRWNLDGEARSKGV